MSIDVSIASVAAAAERIARDFARLRWWLGFSFKASSYFHRLTVVPLFVWFFLVKESCEGDQACRARCSVPHNFFRICSIYCATLCRWILHGMGGIIRVTPQTCCTSSFFTVCSLTCPKTGDPSKQTRRKIQIYSK